MANPFKALQASALAWIARQNAQIRNSRAKSETLRALRNVDAATLRDMGISRAELLSVCMGGDLGRRRTHG